MKELGSKEMIVKHLTEELEDMKFELTKIREKIGDPGASRNVAKAILEVINKEDS